MVSEMAESGTGITSYIELSDNSRMFNVLLILFPLYPMFITTSCVSPRLTSQAKSGFPRYAYTFHCTLWLSHKNVTSFTFKTIVINSCIFFMTELFELLPNLSVMIKDFCLRVFTMNLIKLLTPTDICLKSNIVAITYWINSFLFW